MKLEVRRAIDDRVGGSALLALSPIVRAVGWLLGRSHATLPAGTVLVMKFTGIGSLAIAKPAIARLRETHPGARILFWGTQQTCVLARVMPEFDEVLVLDDGNLWRALRTAASVLVRIWRAAPDWAFDLEVYSKLSVVLCTLTCARNRAGFAVDSVRLRRNNHTHLVFFNRHHYLGEAYRRLFGLLDDEPEARARDANAWCFESSEALADLVPSGRDYVVVNPNAGELSLLRRWPLASFSQVIEWLLDRYDDLEVVVIGAGEQEAAYCAGLPAHPRVHDRVNQLSLPEMIRCVNGARLVLSNDSAPLHLALLSQVPTIGLFGPTLPATYVDPSRPRTRTHHLDIYCSPCVHYWEPAPCGGQNRCMRELAPDDVMRSCVELLEGLDEALPAAGPEGGRDPDDSHYPGVVHRTKHA